MYNLKQIKPQPSIVDNAEMKDPTNQVPKDDRDQTSAALSRYYLDNLRSNFGSGENQNKNLLADWSSGFTRTANQSVVFGLAMALVAVAVGAMMSRSVVRRVGLLGRATAAVGSGDFDTTVALKGDDELSDLSRAFNFTISSAAMPSKTFAEPTFFNIFSIKTL